MPPRHPQKGDAPVNHRTITVVLPAPATDVFAYLSSIENLPDWATDFAQELKVVDGRHKVVNGLGEFFFRIAADERSGVIDMFAGPTEDEMAIFPARVVALPGGRSLFTFTMFQAPRRAVRAVRRSVLVAAGRDGQHPPPLRCRSVIGAAERVPGRVSRRRLTVAGTS